VVVTSAVKAVVRDAMWRPGDAAPEVGQDLVQVRDVVTGRGLRAWKAHGAVFSASFAPDGKTLAVGDLASVRVWDVGSGKGLGTLEHGARVHSVCFAPDGKTLATAEWDFRPVQRGHLLPGAAPARQDGVVRVWDVATGKELRRLPGKAVAFSPD